MKYEWIRYATTGKNTNIVIETWKELTEDDKNRLGNYLDSFFADPANKGEYESKTNASLNIIHRYYGNENE